MERIKEIIYFNKKGILSVFLIILIIGMGAFVFFITTPKEKIEAKKEIIVEEEEIKEEVVEVKECFCDIKGKVKNPGVYKLDCNSRVIDAIKQAGGLTKDADTSNINLSKRITDSMVIKVYSKNEIKNYIKTIEEESKKQELCINDQVNNSTCIESNNPSNINNLININTASQSELMSLEGIGESKAKAIIEYRNKTPFKSIDEIKNVQGIGESLYAKIKEIITV